YSRQLACAPHHVHTPSSFDYKNPGMTDVRRDATRKAVDRKSQRRQISTDAQARTDDESVVYQNRVMHERYVQSTSRVRWRRRSSSHSSRFFLPRRLSAPAITSTSSAA